MGVGKLYKTLGYSSEKSVKNTVPWIPENKLKRLHTVNAQQLCNRIKPRTVASIDSIDSTAIVTNILFWTLISFLSREDGWNYNTFKKVRHFAFPIWYLYELHWIWKFHCNILENTSVCVYTEQWQIYCEPHNEPQLVAYPGAAHTDKRVLVRQTLLTSYFVPFMDSKLQFMLFFDIGLSLFTLLVLHNRKRRPKI